MAQAEAGAKAQQNEAKHDVGDKTVGKVGEAATQAQAKDLSTQTQDMMKEDYLNKKGGAVSNELGEGLSNKAESLSDLMKQQGMDGKLANGIESSMKSIDKMSISSSFKKITEEDRTDAKDKLSKGLSDLIPEADKKTLTDMTNAVVDGNLDAFKNTLKELSNDPAKLDKFIKAFNEQMKKNGSGTELAKDSQGNVLLYDGNGGETAVSINPKTGETTLKPIERQNDGSVVVKPGEIINKTAGDVMKAIGDDTTRDIVRPHIMWKEPPNIIHGHPGFPGKPGGGGGGGGIDFKPPAWDKIKPLSNSVKEKEQ